MARNWMVEVLSGTRSEQNQKPLCCQEPFRVFFGAGAGRAGVFLPAGRRVVAGSGVAWPKSWFSGCEPAALATESFPVAPRLPSRALRPGKCGGPAGVGLEAAADGVADASLEGPEGFPGGLALGELAVVAGPALAVAVADLGDRGHVDGVVEAAVPVPR